MKNRLIIKRDGEHSAGEHSAGEHSAGEHSDGEHSAGDWRPTASKKIEG